mgnify:CR=1 FL=1
MSHAQSLFYAPSLYPTITKILVTGRWSKAPFPVKSAGCGPIFANLCWTMSWEIIYYLGVLMLNAKCTFTFILSRSSSFIFAIFPAQLPPSYNETKQEGSTSEA